MVLIKIGMILLFITVGIFYVKTNELDTNCTIRFKWSFYGWSSYFYSLTAGFGYISNFSRRSKRSGT
ncbi:hypothetical protein ACT7DP_28345 [Bacillus paranthracis]